ncbi:hypothetical protein ACIQNU_41515 [Streptomyces sp. NPDC091292]|uniref:hypothetical protein n=1 Tax=Streptomyces sp. NPDC091292 TaxID=3365991 RepID=UPI003806558D
MVDQPKELKDMFDPIAKALHALGEWLFPATGTHRAPTVVRGPHAAATPKPRRPLPALKSPYAEEAHHPFVDRLPLVRPYLDAAPRPRPTPEQQIQAHRRWLVDMADRGLNGGPPVIHGDLGGGDTLRFRAVA